MPISFSGPRAHAALLGFAALTMACSDSTGPGEPPQPFYLAAKLGGSGGDPTINIIRSDGFVESRITCGSLCSGLVMPRWSQSGRKLAVTARNADRSVLFVVNRDGMGMTEVASVDTFSLPDRVGPRILYRPYLYPDWSADGRIAYVRTSAKGYAIETVGDDGSSRRIVFTDSTPPGIEFQTRVTRPTWGPADTVIAFINGTRIYVVKPDGTGLRALSDTLFNRGGSRADPWDDGLSLAWSPDGRMVAIPRRQDLWIHDVTSGTTRKILSGSWFGLNFCWAPNSTRLAFVEVDGSYEDIVTINADGTDRRVEVDNLPVLYGGDRSIGWSPDGRHLVYHRTPESTDTGPTVLTGPIYWHDVESGEDAGANDGAKVRSFVSETRGCVLSHTNPW